MSFAARAWAVPLHAASLACARPRIIWFAAALRIVRWRLSMLQGALALSPCGAPVGRTSQVELHARRGHTRPLQGFARGAARDWSLLADYQHAVGGPYLDGPLARGRAARRRYAVGNSTLDLQYGDGGSHLDLTSNTTDPGRGPVQLGAATPSRAACSSVTTPLVGTTSTGLGRRPERFGAGTTSGAACLTSSTPLVGLTSTHLGRGSVQPDTDTPSGATCLTFSTAVEGPALPR